MSISHPAISCVVIGINCENTLTACLESMKTLHSPAPEEIIYVDGGSKDKSVSIAKAISGIKVIEGNFKNPTPGKGRNAGWHAATGEWIQFFDGDTIAEKRWFLNAVKYIREGVAAIFGKRQEKNRNKNWFHFIADLEWLQPISDAKFFGGDVLIRRTVLEETGGYDDSLIGGEDPELSFRIRKKGWKIIGADTVMCYHDINMISLKQYLTRAVRSGYAYAEAGLKMLKYGEKEWFFKTAKISLKAILVIALIILGIFSGFQLALILAVATAFFPLLKTLKFKERFKITFKEALIYAVNCSIVMWPQFLGVLKYFLTSRYAKIRQ